MTSRVMILTDHPYASDEHTKWERALVGRGGSLMGRAFSRKGWTRGTFNYQALLPFVPEKALADKHGVALPWARAALDASRPALNAAITRLAPNVIVTFGETATYELTGVYEPLLMMHGYAFWHEAYQCWIVPTFHPEKLCQGQNHLTQVFLWDVAKAVRMASEGYAHEQPVCLMDPPLREWEAYVADYLAAVTAQPYRIADGTGTVLAVDIETPWKRKHANDEDELDSDEDITYTIERISFAYEHGRGISVPWAMPYLLGIEAMLRAASVRGMITIWNRPFDRPRLMKALNMALPLGRCRDAMDSWHVLYNALPKKLGFATSCLPSSYSLRMWKHLNRTEPVYYSCVDAIALWRNDADIMRQLALTGALEVYHLMCRDLDPLLEEMVGAGLLVDEGARQRLHSDLVTRAAELQVEMEAAVPAMLRKQKVWKTRAAAEKGVPLLVRDGTLDTSAEMIHITAAKVVKVCGSCGAPANAAHVTRKFLKEPAHAASA